MQFGRRSASSRSNPSRCLTRAIIDILEDRRLFSAFNWTGGTTGNFDDANNWINTGTSQHGVPGPSDDANIGNSITATVRSGHPITLHSLTSGLVIVDDSLTLATDSHFFNGLTLNAGGSLTLNGGTLDLRGGTIAGALTVASGATVSFNNNVVDVNSGATFSGAGSYHIDGFCTFTLNANITAPSDLVLNGGTVGGSGDLAVPVGATFTLALGDLSGTGTVNVPGGANLAMTCVGTVTIGETVTSAGTITKSGNNAVNFNNLAVLTNSGTFDITNDSTVGSVGSGGTLNNTGTLMKSAGSGMANLFGAILTNSGTVQVESGTLLLGSGSSTGTFQAAANTEINFAGGNSGPSFTLNSGTALAGDGLYAETGSFNTLVVNGDVSVKNFQLNNGFSAGVTGTGTFTITNNFDWIDGAMSGSGVTEIPAGATLAISGDAGSHELADTRILRNDGAATWAGAAPITVDEKALFNNRGTFTANNDAQINGTGTFRTGGTFIKTSAGTTQVAGTFFNTIDTGVLDIRAGTLGLSVDGANCNGTIKAAAGAVVQVQSNLGFDNYTMGPKSSFIGAGQFSVSGDFALLTLKKNLALQNFQLNTDHSLGLVGPGSLTISGTFDWMGGALSTDATTTNTILPGGQMIIHTNTPKQIDGGTLVNLGTATWSDSGDITMNSTVFTNAGKLTALNDQAINPAGPGGTFINTGQFIKSGGTQTTDLRVSVDNQGLMRVTTGVLNLTGALAQISADNTRLKGGTWDVRGGGSLTLPSNVTNIFTNAANVSIRGAGSEFPSFSGLSMNRGSFSVLNGATFSTSAADADSGALTNAGQLTIGTKATVTVNGIFTQTDSGQLSIQLGGDPTTGQFGRLNVTGTSTLASTVAFQPVGGYTPVSGQTFTFMTFPSGSATGSFTVANRSAAGRFQGFNLSNDAADMTAIVGFDGADLQATTASTTTTTANVGDIVTINYSVKNNSANVTPVAQWIDSVYLSADTTFDANDVLLTRVTHNAIVNGGAMYDGQATADVPPILAGSYHFIVIPDSQGFIPNGQSIAAHSAATGAVAVTVPSLTAGTPISGTIAAGKDLLFSLPVESNQTTRVNFRSTAGVGALLGRLEQIPTELVFDESASDPAKANQVMVIATPSAGNVLIRVHGQAAAGNGTAFTLVARTLPFGINRVLNNTGSNLGSATATILGAGLSPKSVVSLVLPGGGTRTASTLFFFNTATLFSTFDLTGLAPGAYDVRVDSGGLTSTRAGAFIVNNGPVGQLSTSITTPLIIRRNRLGTVIVDYQNTGNTDIPAPLLGLTSDKATLRLPDQLDFAGKTIEFIGGNPFGPAGILPPGAKGEIDITFGPTQFAAHDTIHFQLIPVSDPSAPLDLTPFQSGLQPADIASDKFAAAYATFITRVGGTYGGYQTELDRIASSVSLAGQPRADVTQLLYADFKAIVASQPSASATPQAQPLDGFTNPFTFNPITNNPFIGGGGTIVAPGKPATPPANNPPPPPPPINPNPNNGGNTDPRTPNDPNDLIAPAGTAPGHTVDPTSRLNYQIEYENTPTADVPAQVVTITNQLDPSLDPATFQVGDFGFGNITVRVPAGLNSFSTRVDARGTLGLFVDVSANIDLDTGIATWIFSSIDPKTGDITADPLGGFLPPNVVKPQGQGFANYSVKPRSSVAAGTRVNAQASIVFDGNPAIATPLRFNTLGTAAAAPSASPLFATRPTANPFSTTLIGSELYQPDVGDAVLGPVMA